MRSESAARFYIEEALKAGCAVVNCMPIFLASDTEWLDRFKRAGFPIIDRDINQVGATIEHRLLTRLLGQRGAQLDRSYQINFGGNTDFQNMLERERSVSRKVPKTRAVLNLYLIGAFGLHNMMPHAFTDILFSTVNQRNSPTTKMEKKPDPE